MASNSTFRDKCSDVAWQKQLRDRYLAEGSPSVDLGLKRAVVRAVSRRVAEQIIFRYEWLGTMSSTSLHYGIFFGPYCAGVCCVACNGVGAAGISRHMEFGIEREQLATLARGACVHWAPPGANSKLVAWTCRLMARDAPGVKLVIAYSDSDAGEIGTIYQACGWNYVGLTDRPGTDAEIVSPHGRVFNIRMVGSVAKLRGETFTESRDALLEAGWKLQGSNRKHKYVSVIGKTDKALIERIEKMRLPYPKRGQAEAP